METATVMGPVSGPDTVCDCSHWYEEHGGSECGSPGCECPGYVFDPEQNTAEMIADRGGDPAKWPAWLIAERLEYLRGEIEAERISYGEIAELQSLAEHIDPTDVQLLEWAGVPEFPPTCDICGEAQDADSDDWNGDTGQHYSCEQKA